MAQAVILTADQKAAIAHHFGDFRNYLESEQFVRDQADRVTRVAFFREELSTRLDGLSEADVGAVVNKLWASHVWTNKAYQVQKLISDNGLGRIRETFRLLLDTARPVEERYRLYLSQVKGLGPASVTA